MEVAKSENLVSENIKRSIDIFDNFSNETDNDKMTPEKIEKDRRVLELLAKSFPNVSAASTEIINLEAILNLPKGTEHFVADLHGEYDAFNYIMRNASGNIKRKVYDLFGKTMRDSEIKQLCALIYYLCACCADRAKRLA